MSFEMKFLVLKQILLLPEHTTPPKFLFQSRLIILLLSL